MKTLRFPIGGDNDLTKINEIISFQEDKDCEFLDSKVAYVDNAVVNLVTFNQYDAPTTVKELILKEKSQVATSDPTPFWEGVMVTGGNLVVIAAIRK